MELNKEAEFVSQLLQMTQAGELKWTRGTPPQSLWVGTDSKIFDFYSTTLAKKDLGIFELRSKRYDGDREQFYWVSDLSLALFDVQGHHEYTFRVASALWDLFAEVKRQVAGVDDFLESILKTKKLDN